MDKVLPWVKFCIPMRGTINPYFHNKISGLMVDFIRWCEPKQEINDRKAANFRNSQHHWNQAEGLADFWVGDEYFFWSKLKLYDRNSSWPFEIERRGVLFYDHTDKNPAQVLLIATAFQKFLRKSGIKFIRYNLTEKGVVKIISKL